jgi:signal peptidase I
MKGWIKDIIIAGLIALLVMTFIKPTIVKESSMEPTLYANNYLFLSKQAYRCSEPKRGDIIVFHTDLTTSEGQEKLLIKRVIAIQGDTITIEDGSVYVNGAELSEPYIAGSETSGYIDNFKVPDGMIFAMGDHRSVSIDSRDDRVGCVPVDLIVGKAFLRLYPFNKIGFLH